MDPVAYNRLPVLFGKILLFLLLPLPLRCAQKPGIHPTADQIMQGHLVACGDTEVPHIEVTDFASFVTDHSRSEQHSYYF